MNIDNLIKFNRSYRRFDNKIKISVNLIKEWLESCRFIASAANKQQLKFKIVTTEEECSYITENLIWASYLENWDNLNKEEYPSAYIILLSEREDNLIYYDAGIFSQSFLLKSVEQGYGGCILVNINQGNIKEKFKLNEDLSIISIIAIGKPKEIVNVVNSDFKIKYWRDENDIHNVPKKSLNALIL